MRKTHNYKLKDRNNGKKNEDTGKVERFSERVGIKCTDEKKNLLSRELPLLWKPKEENERSRENMR